MKGPKSNAKYILELNRRDLTVRNDLVAFLVVSVFGLCRLHELSSEFPFVCRGLRLCTAMFWSTCHDNDGIAVAAYGTGVLRAIYLKVVMQGATCARLSRERQGIPPTPSSSLLLSHRCTRCCVFTSFRLTSHCSLPQQYVPSFLSFL